LLDVVDEPRQPPAGPQLAERKKKKRRKRRFRWLPRIAIGSMHLSWSLPVFGTLLLFVAAGVGLYLGVKAIKPKGIPTEQWVAVEVVDRFRARLPGKFEKSSTEAFGLPLQFYLCEPNSDSLFAVGLTPKELTPDQSSRPASRRLDDFCAAAITRMDRRRWRELYRETINADPHQCRQLVFSIDDPKGVVRPSRALGGYMFPESNEFSEPQTLWPLGGRGHAVIRFYLAHGRAFVILAAGKEIDLKHPDVKCLFESLEILDPRQEQK
jgi:hypothetical protein